MNTPTILIDNVKSKLTNAPEKVVREITKRLSVKSPNYWFSYKYKMGLWDGTIKFFQRPSNCFPTGLLDEVIDTLSDFDIIPNVVDKRVGAEKYMISTLPENYQISETKVARDYQVEAVNNIFNHNVLGVKIPRGIVNIATNGGKTSIAIMVIKELYPKLIENNSMFLFVTHSKEIAVQAKKSIETDLGIEVGFIGDGKWEEKPITVTIVTTLYKRLKTDQFKDLSKKVIGFVADECLSPNSKILLPNNKYMTIREVCEREDVNEVVSFNLEKQVFETKKIVRKMVTPATEQFWKIWYVDPISKKETGLVATRNHKIWTQNRGYVRVDELTTDDIIKVNTSNPEAWNMESGEYNVKISKISKSIGIIPKYKYNLEVEDNHNYFADGILVSNCHHSKSSSWYDVFTNLKNAFIRIGLTGTVDKSNPINEMRLYSCTGKIISKVSNDYLIESGYSAKPICVMFQINSPELEGERYHDAYNLGIIDNDERLDVITDICEKETNSGNVVLILVEHIEHGKLIQDQLDYLNKRTYFTNGKLSSEERQGLLESLKNGSIDVLISTAILDEGVDVSNINAVIYARGMKSTRKLLQGLGRGLRKKSDGGNLRFYDFIDNTHKQLLQHSLERFEVLKAEKFKIKLLTVKKYKKMTWSEIENG